MKPTVADMQRRAMLITRRLIPAVRETTLRITDSDTLRVVDVAEATLRTTLGMRLDEETRCDDVACFVTMLTTRLEMVTATTRLVMPIARSVRQ